MSDELDTARIDWLERHPHACVIRHGNTWRVTDYDKHANNHRGATVREALDAAMSPIPDSQRDSA